MCGNTSNSQFWGKWIHLQNLILNLYSLDYSNALTEKKITMGSWRLGHLCVLNQIWTCNLAFPTRTWYVFKPLYGRPVDVCVVFCYFLPLLSFLEVVIWVYRNLVFRTCCLGTPVQQIQNHTSVGTWHTICMGSRSRFTPMTMSVHVRTTLKWLRKPFS